MKQFAITLVTVLSIFITATTLAGDGRSDIHQDANDVQPLPAPTMMKSMLACAANTGRTRKRKS